MRLESGWKEGEEASFLNNSIPDIPTPIYSDSMP